MTRDEWETKILAALEGGQKSIRQVEWILRREVEYPYANFYEATKRQMMEMFYRKKLDRMRTGNGERLYRAGTGQMIDSYIPTPSALLNRDIRQARAEKDIPLSKVPKGVKKGDNGGTIVRLTDERPLAWGGQIAGYGKRSKGVLAD
jgi:hypothetical protein